MNSSKINLDSVPALEAWPTLRLIGREVFDSSYFCTSQGRKRWAVTSIQLTLKGAALFTEQGKAPQRVGPGEAFMFRWVGDHCSYQTAPGEGYEALYAELEGSALDAMAGELINRSGYIWELIRMRG